MSRQCTQYSVEFKEKLLGKVFSQNSPSPVELAKSHGVPYGTLHTWIKMRKNKNIKQPLVGTAPENRTAEDKLRMVIATLEQTDAERGAYCRAEGVYTHHLESWKAQILSGLTGISVKQNKAECQQLTHANKKLQSELNRKDKALAEISALLILKKKADLLWGGKEAD